MFVGLLFQLLFWGGIIWLVVWLVSRDKNKAVDINSPSYAQGYWDGYRARQNEMNPDTSQSHEATMPTFASVAPALQLSTPDRAAEKEKHDIQNINTTLYVASFLLVAAAALFIGTALPESTKFIGLWLITIVFYVVGLVLHDRVPKLKPAAVAFTGTGLALLPFTGWAMYQYVLPDAALCWLITSVIGLAAFVLATLRLNSQVIAYFAIAFMVSFVSSSVAVSHGPVVWYFVVLIGFGSLVTLLAAFYSKWLPAVFSQPVQQSGKWIVPLTLIVSLLFSSELSLQSYVILTGLATMYYAAVAATTAGTAQSVAVFVTRLIGSLFILLLSYKVTQSWLIVSLVMSAIGAVQVSISTYLRLEGVRDIVNEIWLYKGFAMLVIAPIFAIGTDMWAVICSWQLGLLLLMSGIVAVVLRRTSSLYFGIYGLLVLPLVVGFGVIQPAAAAHWIALSYLAAAVLALYARATVVSYYPSLRISLMVAYGVFTGATLLCSGAISQQWNLAIWALATSMLYAAVYLEKQRLVMGLASLSSLVTIGWLVENLDISSRWKSLAIAAISLAVLYPCAMWLRQRKQEEYGRILLWTSLIASSWLAFIPLWSRVDDIVIAAGAILTTIGLLLAYEGTYQNQYKYYDAALIVVTVALQRLLSVAAPGLDGLVYSHWWALVAVALGYLYYQRGDRTQAKTRLIISLTIMSFFGGIAALASSSDEPYRLLFLIEHALLLVAGLHFHSKLASIWGAVGVVLAVLWMLSGYTFLLLFFIGLVLIGGAIYALTRQSKR